MGPTVIHRYSPACKPEEVSGLVARYTRERDQLYAGAANESGLIYFVHVTDTPYVTLLFAVALGANGFELLSQNLTMFGENQAVFIASMRPESITHERWEAAGRANEKRRANLKKQCQ